MVVSRYLAGIFEASEIENRREILRLVEAHGPSASLLDLGCYDGAFTSEVAIAAGATEVVGVEFLPEHAAKARDRGIEAVFADLHDALPFASDRFDLVHANQVIEHLKGTDRFLAEAARVAKPGGLVLISTNNLASWHNIFSLTMGYQPHPNHVSDEVHVGNPLNPRGGVRHADAGQTHLRIFTGRALSELAGHHGLQLVEMGASGYYPFPPAVARRLARLDRRHAAFLIGVFRAQPAATCSVEGAPSDVDHTA